MTHTELSTPQAAPHGNPSGGLEGKVVVIFGGTSGIGLATARQATALGGHVTVIGSDPTRARQAAEEHGLAGWRAADVRSGDAILEAVSSLPRVDHLVMLAGTLVVGKILETDVTHLRRAFDERVWASIHAIRSLAHSLAEDASITLTSGQLADRPTADGTAVVAAAAAAIETLARGLALELAPRRFNTLSPGFIETPLLEKAFGEQRDGIMAGIKGAALLKRIGSADEAASAIIFLMTNRYMNGATLHIDGGGRLR